MVKWCSLWGPTLFLQNAAGDVMVWGWGTLSGAVRTAAWAAFHPAIVLPDEAGKAEPSVGEELAPGADLRHGGTGL